MLLALLSLLLASDAAEGRTFTVEPARSAVLYHIVHKFHDVTGKSSTIEGKAIWRADGSVLAMVRIPMASFDSGERNRDADMRETVEATRHPHVVFRGIAHIDPVVAASEREEPLKVKMEGEVELHGVKRPATVPLEIEFSPGAARVRGSFDVSLDAFGIERPSLLFIKIDDACKIDLDLLLRG